SPTPIRAILVPSRREYDRLVVDLLGVDIEVPSNPGRVAQPQRTDIVFLSPSAYRQHSTYSYDADEYRRLVFHELVHVFEEHLSPDIEAAPRWWSEGLAAYLSGQWRCADRFRFRQPVLEGITLGHVPRISEIEADVQLCYAWGWTLVMFIEKAYSRDTVVRIVRECDDGDVLSTLGEDPHAFEKGWQRWLLQEDGRFRSRPPQLPAIHGCSDRMRAT
ncbi:MAG: hypothetical protein ACNA7X_04550, partial [Dehalococcoidia bacterium]